MSKLVCMGECLIDFLPSGNGVLSFDGKAGGAPANVCAAVGKLGGDAYYLGMMSRDSFGTFLLEKLRACSVKTDYVHFTDKAGTGLAFVSLDENGDRSFTFFRDPCADMLLEPDMVNGDMFEKGDVLHFCSVDLVECPTKYAHRRAIECAREAGAYVSFDVNLRLNIWRDDAGCVATVREFLAYADIVKVTDDELLLITGENDIDRGVQMIFNMAENASLVFVTKGGDGASVYSREGSIHAPARHVNVVDTTGAGDCFSGAVIYNILMREDTDKTTFTLDEICPVLDMATRACSIIVGRKGAMESMPTLSEIESVSD